MAGFLPQDTLERIRAASDIVDVIGGYLPLKRAGANFRALCPFHKEKTPSFNVNPQKQIFHCFGCHKGGDVFTFVKEYENIGFMDAVRRLADRAKIPLELDATPGAQEARHIKDQLLHVHEQITQRWQNTLANEAAGQLARDYLAKRGVSGEAIKLFRLGAAPDAWDDTVNWAKSKGHDLSVIEQGGLIIQKSEAGSQRPDAEGPNSDLRPPTSDLRRYYDRFRGRLMFPICDEQGRVIGFSGRVLTGDEKTAKYVNSPETPIFTKSKVFFGLDKSKRAILDAGFAIVCEGQLDLIASFMAGVQNIVAPQGTAFTDQHARILKRYADEVVLCFDSDNAGQNAAVRSLDSLLASGLAVRVAVVPAPHDPDSFIKANGGETFRKLIERAEGFFDYFLGRLCATNDTTTDKGRLAVLRAMAEAVNKTGNVVLIDKHAQQTAHRLGVSSDAVRLEFKKTPLSRPVVAAEDTFEGIESSADEQPASDIERWLLKVMLLDEDLVGWVADRLDYEWIQDPSVREIIKLRVTAFRTDSWRGAANFLSMLQDDSSRKIVSEALAERKAIPDIEATLKGDPNRDDERGVLHRLRDDFIARRIAFLSHRLSQQSISEAESLENLKQQQQLRQLKRQPLAPLGEAH